MNPAPAGLFRHRTAFTNVDPAIGDQVNMEAMGLVKFKDPEATQFRPASSHECQEVVPALPGVLDVQNCPATIKNGSRRQLKLTPGDNYK